MNTCFLHEVSPYGKGWIYQPEKQEKMTEHKKQKTNMSSVRPEALHKMTSTRDALHQIHNPALSVHIRINLPTPWHEAYSAHLLYLRPRTKPSPLPSRPHVLRLQAKFQAR